VLFRSDFVGRFGIDTAPEDLGEMTVSVLRGPDGRQKKELNKLVDFLTEGPRPDVVHLTNSLLSAIAPAVKDALDVAVVCGLQGEDAFVERIGEPWREEALRLMRRHAGAVDLFVAPGEAYADDMAGLLSTERSRIRVVRAGIDLAPFEAPVERPREVFRIGYLSRIVPEKGLDLLCEAFRLLEEEQPGRCELAIAGEATGTNRAFRDAQLKRLAEAGLDERVEYVGAPDLAGKVGFLKRCSTFSLPSRVGERQAVASLEAQACGVPVVVPDLGIHREVLLLTGGGVLVRPNDARALADALATLRDDEPRARALGERAAAGVREHFSSNAMVEKTLGLYREVSHA